MIYVIQSDGGPIKVGRSINPEHRRKMLTIQQPYDMKTIFVCEVQADREAQIERLAHSILAPYHLRGEWFITSPEIAIAAVETAKAQPLWVEKAIDTPAKVTAARAFLGYSKAELARALRLGPNGRKTIRAWESGKTRGVPGAAQIALERLVQLKIEGEAK